VQPRVMSIMWGSRSNSSVVDTASIGSSVRRPEPDYFERNGWPDPGWPYSNQPALLTGLFAVAVGQVLVIAYHYFHLRTSSPRIQKSVLPPSSFWVDAAGHLSQPEGFILLGSYLAGTWMFRIMPESYYSSEGGVNLWHVFLQVAARALLPLPLRLYLAPSPLLLRRHKGPFRVLVCVCCWWT
jgi:hypothetical protein